MRQPRTNQGAVCAARHNVPRGDAAARRFLIASPRQIAAFYAGGGFAVTTRAPGQRLLLPRTGELLASGHHSSLASDSLLRPSPGVSLVPSAAARRCGPVHHRPAAPRASPEIPLRRREGPPGPDERERSPAAAATVCPSSSRTRRAPARRHRRGGRGAPDLMNMRVHHPAAATARRPASALGRILLTALRTSGARACRRFTPRDRCGRTRQTGAARVVSSGPNPGATRVASRYLVTTSRASSGSRDDRAPTTEPDSRHLAPGQRDAGMKPRLGDRDLQAL